MITEETKRRMAMFLKTFTTTAKVGNGGDSTNPSSNDLDSVVSSSSSFSTVLSDENVVDFNATFNSLNGETIREFGIFATLPSNEVHFNTLKTNMALSVSDTISTAVTTDTIMIARFNFDALGPFTASDTIDITLVAEVE
tara:strand:- start:1545 stop:1964 length:420 start_codon:yes stop_codon:yes gene_type:complete